jgi:hypothetical protein
MLSVSTTPKTDREATDGKIDLNVTYHDGDSQWWINNSTPGM